VRLARSKVIAEPAPVGSISTRRKICLGIGAVLLVSGIGTLMPHSSFEFGMKLPQTTKATARIRCAPRPGPTRKFIERLYAAAGVRPPPEGFLIAVDLPPPD